MKNSIIETYLNTKAYNYTCKVWDEEEIKDLEIVNFAQKLNDNEFKSTVENILDYKIDVADSMATKFKIDLLNLITKNLSK